MFERFLTMSGSLDAKLIRPKKASLLWKASNLPNLWRGWWKKQLADTCGIATMYGQVRAMVYHADGTVTDYGLISTRLVTTAFVTALATNMYDGSAPAPTAFDYHDAGTGVGAESSGDTALGTAWGGSRVSGTASNPGAGQYRSVATITFNNTFAITEHGVFSASTSGTLLDRSVFTAINVINGDSIQFTYTLTISAGG